MRKEKGITLIALIITIIVLLILAVVSITAITDNDKGVVSKAQQAAKKTEDERNKEVDVLGELNDEMDEELNSGTDNESNNGTANDVDFTNAPKLNQLVSSESYGIKTNYSVNGIDDWRIFYENEDGRVFLIAADYLPVEKLEAGMEMKTTGKYQYFWTSAPAFVTPAQAELFMATGYSLNSSYASSKCAAALLNVNKWTSFVDTSLADYAIGGPTLEMWIASWNAKYNDSFTFTTGTYGYQLSGGNISLGYTEAEENCESTGYGNVYFPHPNTGYVSNGELLSYEGCCGYWLASPYYYGNSINVNSLYLVNGRGAMLTEVPLTGDPNSSDKSQPSVTDAVYNGIRPVVCLKEGVKAVEKDDGTLVLGM